MILLPSRAALTSCFAALLVAGFLTFSLQLRAATITAASVSFDDVSAAVASAVDGDIVMIPAGTATWTSTFTLTKGITLLGASSVQWAITTATGASLGVNANTFTSSQSLNVVSTSGFAATGILDVLTGSGLRAVTYTGISGNAFTGCSCSGSGVISNDVGGQPTNVVGQRRCIDATIIQDNVTPRNTLLNVITASNKTYRITGITFTSAARSFYGFGMVQLTGRSHSVRMDHCHFTTRSGASSYIYIDGPIYGVIDHNVIEEDAVAGHPYAFSFNNGHYTDNIGHAEWSSQQNLVAEIGCLLRTTIGLIGVRSSELMQ
jgi:hypothetical protein